MFVVDANTCTYQCTNMYLHYLSFAFLTFDIILSYLLHRSWVGRGEGQGWKRRMRGALRTRRAGRVTNRGEVLTDAWGATVRRDRAELERRGT